MPLIQADARAIPLADESVNCCVTSPPYWGLRDYGVTGQLGLEPTPEAFIENMVAVFREVRRVLRKDATCWVNLGDSYATGAGSYNNPGSDVSRMEHRGKQQYTKDYPSSQPNRMPIPGLKPKDLCMIPARVALALQADGWWLRSVIIWAKANPMPESVTDRPTTAHEYVYLLTKAERYWYDAEAVREADSGQDHPRSVLNGQPSLEPTGGLMAPHKGLRTTDGRNGSGRNARTVWTLPTQPYPNSHFATFPEALPERCILAGCPDRVCEACGAPWVREVERGELVRDDGSPAQLVSPVKRDSSLSAWSRPGGKVETVVPNSHREKRTLGFSPTCTCNAGTRPGVVLDPFVGSGTTVQVARRHGRVGIGLDISWPYLHDHALARGDGKTSVGAITNLPLFGGERRG